MSNIFLTIAISITASLMVQISIKYYESKQKHHDSQLIARTVSELLNNDQDMIKLLIINERLRQQLETAQDEFTDVSLYNSFKVREAAYSFYEEFIDNMDPLIQTIDMKTTGYEQ